VLGGQRVGVDPALVHRPKRWHISFVRQFMMIIGPISSLYDFLTFAVLLWIFNASTSAALFRTGWFVESLATQTLVVFVIRTAGNPFKSLPSPRLLASVAAVVAMATALPYTPIGSLLRFTPLPVSLLGAIAFLAPRTSFWSKRSKPGSIEPRAALKHAH
jgi:P-type Mg2+ transporter